MKKYSKDGYKRNSKDRKNPYNIIPSGKITMKDVDFPVHGTDNLGNSQIMMPGGEYVFPGNEVFEVPLAQNGIELETQPVEINTEGLRRPLHVHGQPIISDNLSENPMDQTPRNYVNDRIEYWEDPNSLAKNRMEGEYLDDNFIEPIGQTSDRVLDYVKDRSKTDFEKDRKIFLKNLSNIAFLDMTDDQKYAQELLEEYAANNEDPFDMISNYEKYGYETIQELFEDRPDIKHIGRMSMNEDANYESSSAAVAMTADDEFLERHLDDIRLYNIMNSTAIKEGRKEKRGLSYERGDLLEKKYIDAFLEDHGEDPNDPKWDKIRAFIIMNPDMHKLHSEMDEDDYNTTLAHEIGHVERAEFLSDQDIYLLQTFNNTSDNLPKNKRTDHHSNTGEAYADITAIRQDMLDRGIYDWRYEQMTNDHWQQYLSEYEEDDYPLVLQRTIERYRVLPGEEEWDTHNKKQLETKDQDTNIIYLNNNIADAEIGDDVDMGYAQKGGELKKFQGGGEDDNADDYTYENMIHANMIHANMQTQYQNEVKNPGAYPQPDLDDIWVSEDSEESYFTEMSVLEEKLKALQGGLANINTDFINETTENAMSGRDDLSLQVDHTGGLGHSVINDITNSKYNDILKENEKAKIEAEIALLQEEAKIINTKYIKPEYTLDPSDPNSFYHEHYLKEQKYIFAEKQAYYNKNPQAYLDDNPGSGPIITQGDPEKWERDREYWRQKEEMSKNRIPPNMMFMVYASPGLTTMYQQAQITGDYSGINQQVANFNPANPENLLQGIFMTPLPILNYGVNIGKFGKIPGLIDDVVAPRVLNLFEKTKLIPGVSGTIKSLDDIITNANKPNAAYTVDDMFYRNFDGTVGIRPNVAKPPKLDESTWRHLQTLEFDPAQFAKKYPGVPLPGVDDINIPMNQIEGVVPNVMDDIIANSEKNLLLPATAQTIGNRVINYTGQNDVVDGNYQTQLFDNVSNNTLQVNTLREGTQTYNKLFNNTDKNGYVSRQLLEKIINGAPKGDKLYLEKVLNNPIYSGKDKIPLVDYTNDVSSSIAPLNKVVSATHDKDWNKIVDGNGSRQEGYGYSNIGYNIDLDNIRGYTVSLQNPQKLGFGDTHLGGDMNKYNLGWFRGMTTKENPHIFTKVENQSNWYAHGNNKKNPNKYGEVTDMTTFSQPPSDWTGTKLEWIQLQRNNELDKLTRELLDANDNLNLLNQQWDVYQNEGFFDTRKIGMIDELGNKSPNPYYDKIFIDGENASTKEINNIYNNTLKNNTERINILNSKINALENTDAAGQLALATNNGIYNRALAESIVWAAQEGFTTYRIPTVKTSAKLQGHDRDIIQVQNWDDFVVNIDQSKDFLSGEITQGTNQLKLHEPLVDEAILTGGLKVRRTIKDGFLDKDGFVKPRFQRKYEKELERFQKESRDAKENMKNRRTEYSLQVESEVEKELIDLHYEMYLADESIYTGSHDRWIYKEPGIRQMDPETMELGEIPYRDVPQRGGRDGIHNQPWREELYQKQLELGRQLTKEELINFGIMGNSNSGMISTQGGQWGFSHGGRGIGKSRDESIEYERFTDDEYKRLRDVQNKIYEVNDRPKNALEEWTRVERLKLKDLQKQMDNDFINIWYNETELLIPNSPGVTDHYFTYSPTNNNLAEQDQLVSYFDNYKDYSKVDLDNPATYNFEKDKNWEGMYRQLQKEPDLVKKWFGDDVEMVLVQDAYGNQYYEFVIPQSVYDGTWQIPSRKRGGQVYQDGGSYIKGSSEDPNIYPDQEYTWYNPMDWYRDWSSISPEEVLANAREEGYESWYSVLPKHLQNSNYYDLEGAYEAGLDPVWSKDHNEYHLGSRDPRTGKLFKYEDHPTFNKLIQGETDEGNIIWYDDSGDMYSGKEVPEGMYEFEEYSDQYLNEYLQFVENSLKTGFEPVTGLWKPYKGVDSDGNKEKFYTLGYGHKLSKQEYKLYKKGVSQEKVDEFLQDDIGEAQRKLDVRYGDHQWYRDLHPREKAILLDIEYNVKGGMNAFPKLLDAIKTGNKTLLLTEFWRDLPEGKENRRNQEFKRKFVIPVSNMYKYNKRQTGGEIKQMQEERPVWDKRRSRLKQQLKIYQQGGEISPFAEEELVNLGLIDDLSMPMDNTMVATNTVNLSLLDLEMHLTPKSDNEEEFGEMDFAGSAKSNANDDDEEEDIENEEEEDDDDAGDEEEEDNNEEDDDKDSEDDDKEDDKEDDEEDDDEEDDEEDDEHFTPEPIEVDSYASGRGSQYERMKPSDDTWTGSPNRVSQPMQIPPTRVKPGQIREYQAPIPRDFTSQMLAAEFARSNYGEQEKPLTFDYLQRTYGDFNPARQQMQQAQDGTELPNVIINENSPQLYDQTDNTIYVHPEDVDGTEIPFIGEHEPDHVLRHELEHYYQNKDIVETTPMAPTALDFDIMSNTASYPGMKSDDPMSNRLIEDRELVMKDMYLNVLDPDGTNFWLQNMDIEDLMDEMALDNEAIYQLERQVMNQPIHVRDYMLARIRGERANLLYNQAIDDVYYDPRTLEGQARMIEDTGRQDAHVIETLKQTAIKNREEGISDHPYIKSEMKTLQKDK
jgi:hypothetical protein